MNYIVAFRVNSGSDSESDEDETGNDLDEFKEYWIGWITQRLKKVTKKEEKIDGLKLKKDDVYFYVQWCDHVGDRLNGDRDFEMVGTPEIFADHGALIPVKLGKKRGEASRIVITSAQHDALMSRLQLASHQ